jgi:PAS domain S-box-containing protein
MTLLRRPATSEALRASEERLQLALRAGGSGVWDWDMRGDVAEVTPSYRELFGLPPGTPVTYETWLSAVHPEDRARCRAYGEAFFAGRDTEWRLAFRIVTAHMEVRWHRAIGKVYRDAEGKPVRFVGVSTDVTEEQRAFAALRESEERFRAMADGLPLIVWVHDAQGSQQFVNRTFLEYFGVAAADMKGERWQIFVHPDDATAYTDEFLACTRERRPFHAEVRVRNAKGEWRTLESWGRPRFSGHGEFLGMVGTSVDVTDRRLMEQTLREADRRKDEFLAMLGHELRNPLAAIAAAMEIFRRLLPADSPLQEVLVSTDRQTAILRRLVDDLLDSARISTGKIELRKAFVPLHQVISGAVELAQPGIVERRHQFAVEQTGERLMVHGDEVRLVQVVANLLNNAARYTPEGGRIALILERAGGEALIRVRDNGGGIEPAMLTRVFELFVQGDKSSADALAPAGLGLGLTLVKRLLDLHGGTVEAKSEGRGKGSEFIVRLPLAAAGTETAAAPGPSQALPAGPARRVLVVDDNRDAADVLSTLIRLLGHEVREAYDGASALESLPAFRPDVVLLDIGLPDMDGYTVTRRLRGLETGRAARVIAMSGFGSDADKARAREHGIERHLIKPVDLTQLEELFR